MKSILQTIAENNRKLEMEESRAAQAELNDPSTSANRRNFLKKTALGGLALTGLMSMKIEDTIAQTTAKVNRMSAPSDLKITDGWL